MYRVHTVKDGITYYKDFETEKEAEDYGRGNWDIYWINKL